MNGLVLKMRSQGRYFAALAAAFALVTAPTGAVAQTNFFVPPGGAGGSGTWNDPTNWTLGTLPAVGETATIHRGRVATLDIPVVGQLGFIRIADNDFFAPLDGVLNIEPGASVSVANKILLAAGGPTDNHGVINQSGGTVTVDDAIFIAFNVTHTAEYNISDGTVNTGNLWFRFGNGTMTQTGGDVNAAQLVLAEGGGPLTNAAYNLQGGTLNVTGDANIGKAPGGPGDPFGGSYGVMNLSGGVATFGDLLFGNDTVNLDNDPTDVINLSGSGILRVDQANYSEADALADISAGKIFGSNLVVSTFNGAAPLTQISVIPEPASVALALFLAAAATCVRRGRSSRV